MTVSHFNKPFLKLFFFTLFCCLNTVYSQPSLPQRTISAIPTQPIDFGTFYVIGAGTITVNWQGSVSTTGGVVVVSSLNSRPAIFDITLCQGRNVTLTYNPTTTITNGAPSITLTLDDTEKGPSGATFAVDTNCTFITTLRVGGTLVIPDGAAKGVYTGSFSMNFTQN
jgi:S-formylglutathione hydrolase FrmB